MRLIVVGAGGHGQVVCDALLAMASAGSPVVVSGFVDDRTDLCGTRLLGVPVLGRIDAIASFPHDALIIAVGDNRVREDHFVKLSARGERFFTVIHPRAVIAPDVVIGAGSMVIAGAIVNTGSCVGANTILNTGCTVDHHNVIGDHVHIAPGAHLGGDVQVGDRSLVGIGSTVMPGRTIGSNSTVGAGSVVRHDVAAGQTVAGVPARPLKSASVTRS